MSTIGIVIGSGFIDRAFRVAVLTKDGESYVALKQDICFSIPSVCPLDLAMRCGLEAYPDDEAQLGARVEVLKRLRIVQRQVELAVIGLSRKVPSIYDSLRSKDPNQWTEVKSSEVAIMLYKHPTATEMYATHKLLMDNPMRFVASNQYTADEMFKVRPLNGVNDLLQVLEWVRNKDPALNRFIAKAKEVADVQIKLRESSRGEQPAYVEANHSWSETDKVLIRLCVASLAHQRSIQLDPYLVPVGHLIRHFYGLRTVSHGDNEIHRLLMDIGVYAPWQDPLTLDPAYKLDLDMRPATVQEQDQRIVRALENSKELKPRHPEDFYARDPLESVRHDWGNMPVYVIDDPTAEELDDGISVERIESEPGYSWVHVHIADPGSLIPPTHFLAQKAANQFESWYTVTQTFSLFPKSLIHHPVHGLSLGIKSKNGIPDRVLTFSAKVDPEGILVDYAVRAGLVRNVKIINYESVDATLGIPGAVVGYPFGGAPTPQRIPVLSDFAEDLDAFHEIASKQRQRRVAMNWIAFDSPSACVERTSPIPLHPSGIIGAQIDDPCLHKGFPSLVYTVVSMRENCEAGARAIVAEMMKLACRVGARFLSDRNVPAAYRAGPPLVPVSEDAIQTLLSKRDEFGYINERDAMHYFLYKPPAQYQNTPGLHFGLGVPQGQGYVRVTSPLRRYNDLVAHWQIQNVLLNEKAGKTSKNGVKGMFDSEWMDKFLQTLQVKSQTLKGVQRRHDRFWALRYILHWQETFADGKNRHLWPKDAQGNPIPDPLEGLEGYMSSGLVANRLLQQLQLNVTIPKLGLQPIVEDVPKKYQDEMLLGRHLGVNLSSIRLGVKANMSTTLDESRIMPI